MKSRLACLFGLLLFFSPLITAPTFAAENRVILDQLLTGDIPQLNASDIKIPDDLKPGYHELQVEVLDDSGVISSKTALFCKDLTGELHFDNLCPDLLVTTEQKTFRSALKPFSPNSDPIGTASLALVAFAVASSLLGFGNRFKEADLDLQKSDEESVGDLGGVSASKLSSQEKELAWGDRRKYINSNIFTALDDLSINLTKGVSTFSALLSRAIFDARYLRAIFGNLAWITLPAALTTSFIGLQQIDNQALPLLLIPMLILMAIGILDSFAGFAGALLYLNFIFANGNLISKDAVFTTLGVALIFFAPGLIASKFRPLTRTVRDFSSLWERLTDYALATILTGWTVAKLVQALPGLSKLDLPIAQQANLIGLVAGLIVSARFLLEEISWYLYPERLRKLTIEVKEPGAFQNFRGIIFKLAIFFFLAEPFIGLNNYLIIGCAIFLIPLLMGLVADNLPKSRYLAQINPRGAFKILILSLASILIVRYLKSLDLSPEDFILNSFVFLPLPAFMLILLDNFSGSRKFDITKNIKARYFYRVSGVFVFGLLLLVVLGFDPFEALPNFFANYSQYQQDFLTILQDLGSTLITGLGSTWAWASDLITKWGSEATENVTEFINSLGASIKFGWENFSSNMTSFWDWAWSKTFSFFSGLRVR